jgi:hypothetical protein
MKALNKVLRITLAATLTLSQGAWLAPALASSGSKHQTVVVIDAEELKSEYGAGGGGGGSNPTPDPGTGGGSSSCLNTSSNAGCSLVAYGEPYTQIWSYQDGADSYETTFDAITKTSSNLVFKTNCSIEIVTISGSVSPGSGGLEVSIGEYCRIDQDYTATAPLGYSVDIYRRHNIYKRRTTQTVAWYKNGIYTGYYGNSIIKELTKRYDSFFQSSARRT